ncbi:MAG: DUF6089 family protein [Cytophagaceae bacterium]
MKKIGKYLFPIFFVFIAFSAKGQKNEIGISLGGMNYTGELAPEYNFSFYRPGGMLFYRHNFSPAFTLRASGMIGNIYGNDEASDYPLHNARNAEFHNSINEFGLMAEYNFFDYRRYKDRRKFTPYMTGGLAVFNYKRIQPGTAIRGSAVNISIPIGFGFKYQLSKTLNLGGEFVARKTFTDHLDGLTDTFDNGRKQLANPYLNDWYFYTGFSISYTIYTVPCPKFN